jgi:hypothetical protein
MSHIRCISFCLLRLPLTVSKKHVESNKNHYYFLLAKWERTPYPQGYPQKPAPPRVIQTTVDCQNSELPATVKGSAAGPKKMGRERRLWVNRSRPACLAPRSLFFADSGRKRLLALL